MVHSASYIVWVVIAGLIVGRKMIIPQTLASDFSTLVKRSVDAAVQAKTAINELDELLETGFRGNEVKVVENMIIELNAIEHDTDEMQVELRKGLFKIENSLSPVDVIFLYSVIKYIGDLADYAQNVGGRLQLLLAS